MVIWDSMPLEQALDEGRTNAKKQRELAIVIDEGNGQATVIRLPNSAKRITVFDFRDDSGQKRTSLAL